MSPDVTFRAIDAFRLVTAAPERLAAFYRQIGFDVGETSPIAGEEMRMLGLEGRGSRRAMTLGPSRVDLDTFDRPGSPYPIGTATCDLVFQHLALVTDDAECAWRMARNAGAVPISRTCPVTLPKSVGGITAVKFRDPDGHPLEIIQFPAGVNSDWSGKGLMGIDHSAISVADISASRRFYTSHGLNGGERSLNRGPSQVALDALGGAVVEVVPMNPSEKPPHVELLGYRHPIGAPCGHLAANDIGATRIVWRSHHDALLRDPDGHLHQLMR